jgi:hypothetical protein
MTPHAPCMQCQWHCMHRACGINDTACTCACSVNDTACTGHAVSMTPHAPYMWYQWHRIHFEKFEFESSRIRIYIWKGPLIRSPGRMSWHCPFKDIKRLFVTCNFLMGVIAFDPFRFNILSSGYWISVCHVQLPSGRDHLWSLSLQYFIFGILHICMSRATSSWEWSSLLSFVSCQ